MRVNTNGNILVQALLYIQRQASFFFIQRKQLKGGGGERYKVCYLLFLQRSVQKDTISNINPDTQFSVLGLLALLQNFSI